MGESEHGAIRADGISNVAVIAAFFRTAGMQPRGAAVAA